MEVIRSAQKFRPLQTSKSYSATGNPRKRLLTSVKILATFITASNTSISHSSNHCLPIDFDMSKYQPTKQHLQEALLVLFNLKKTAIESHKILVKAYGKRAPSEQKCRDTFQQLSGTTNLPSTKRHFRDAMLLLFHVNRKASVAHRMLSAAYGEVTPSLKTIQIRFKRFKQGCFDMEDCKRTGRPKIFEDQELQELLDADPTQTRRTLAEALNISKTTMSKRLKALGLVFNMKCGRWMPGEGDEMDEIDEKDEIDEMDAAETSQSTC